MSIELKALPDELRQRFLELKSQKGLADLLDVPLKQLIYHARVSKNEAKYTEFIIPKKSGGTRSISAPVTALKILQRKLNQVLASVYERRPGVNGFAFGKSIRTNADVHVGARYVLNVDLKDFFPSINFGRVRGLFMAKPYSLAPDVATLVAQIACHESLPQGAPSSPIISNMICARLDARLLNLAVSVKCKYSRYADDLTFSTTLKHFPKALAYSVTKTTGEEIQLGSDLLKIILDEGFNANPDKIRLRTKVARQEVTGLTINQFPNVRRRYINQLRAMLHAWSTYGYDLAESEFREKYDHKQRNPNLPACSFRRVVKGKLDFLRMVRGQDDPVYVHLARQYESVDKKFKLVVRVGSRSRLATIREALWVLETNMDTDKGLITVQGTAFALAGVGLVSCSHVVYAKTEAFRPENPNHRYPVSIVSTEPTIDLTVMTIPAECPVQLVRGESNVLRETDPIQVLGFPNYNLGDQGLLNRGVITGSRPRSGITRLLVDAHIVSGNSGGPVLDKNNLVIGVAVTGADRDGNAPDTENHGVIPIEALAHLVPK